MQELSGFRNATFLTHFFVCTEFHRVFLCCSSTFFATHALLSCRQTSTGTCTHAHTHHMHTNAVPKSNQYTQTLPCFWAVKFGFGSHGEMVESEGLSHILRGPTVIEDPQLHQSSLPSQLPQSGREGPCMNCKTAGVAKTATSRCCMKSTGK